MNSMYKKADFVLHFSLIHTIKDNTGQMNIDSIAGNQSISNIAPIKGYL